jgi:hypothetical protein
MGGFTSNDVDLQNLSNRVDQTTGLNQMKAAAELIAARRRAAH